MDYYTIDSSRLGQNTRIPINKLGDSAMVFQAMAADMVQSIETNNQNGKTTLCIVPVGPVGQYPYFVDMVNAKKVDLKRVWFINMDEYLNDDGSYIDTSHRLSFRGFMEHRVYANIDPKLIMSAEQRIFPDPQDIGNVQRIIDKVGCIDVCYGGIGITGHVAFNEPEPVSVDEFATRPSRVLDISPETRTINAVGDLNGAIFAMPKRCVTIGMKEILQAKRIRLYCFRDWHRAVVRHAAYGEVSALFPVTLLQHHPDTLITITDNVAQPAY